MGRPIIPGNPQRNETASFDTEFQGSKPIALDLKIPADRGKEDVLAKGEKVKRMSFEGMGGGRLSKSRKKTHGRKLGSIGIECMGFRFPTTESVACESLSRLVKLECQDPDCIAPICNHGVYKSVTENRHKV